MYRSIQISSRGALRALRCTQDVVLIAFDWDFLAQVEAMDSTILTGALGSDTLTEDDIRNIRSLGIDFINWEHSAITADDVNKVHLAGLELWVWTLTRAMRNLSLSVIRPMMSPSFPSSKRAWESPMYRILRPS